MDNKFEFDISVIIPIYNVEEYLRECLDSLLDQGPAKLQVIMINDGSPDGSGEIAEEYANRYDNYECYSIENGGLGHARNYAMQYVKGKYTIFIDSDDVIVPGTFSRMMELSEKYGSDMTICNVVRFNSKGAWASDLFEKVFSEIEDVSHITKNHRLLYDTTAWNKLILTSFFKENNFKFAENILYEDIPCTIPMHYKANKVAMLNSIGYLWRVRDGATKSITQNTSSNQNLIDRLEIVRMLDKFYKDELKNPEMWIEQQKKTLETDLMIFVRACDKMPEDQAMDSLERIKNYIETSIDPDIIGYLNIVDQKKYECVLNLDLQGLIKVLQFQKIYDEMIVEEQDGRLIVKIPKDILGVNEYDVTESICKQPIKCQINDVKIKDTSITVVAHAFRAKVDIPEGSERKLKVYLYNEANQKKILLSVEDVATTELTSRWGKKLNPTTGETSDYNYDGAGFSFHFDFKDLELNDFIGINKILVEYEDRFGKKSFLLKKTGNDVRAKKDNTSILCDDDLIILKFAYLGEISFNIKKLDMIQQDVNLDNNQINCLVSGEEGNLFFKNKEETVIYTEKGKSNIYSAPISSFEFGSEYLCYIGDAKDNQFLYGATKTICLKETQEELLVVNTTSSRNVRILFLKMSTKIDEISRDKKIVKIRTSVAGNKSIIKKATEARLIVRDEKFERDVIMDTCTCDFSFGNYCCEFKVNFANEKMIKDFYQSLRTVQVEYLLEGETIKTDIYSEKYYNYIITHKDLKITVYRDSRGMLMLKLTLIWPEAEDSVEKRKLLTYKNYPEYRKKKLDKHRIIFESMWGGQYSCNPQALYEYIDENYPQYECIWSLKDPRTPIKGNGIRVRRGSQKYFEYLATAKYLVNNVNFENAYVKRKGQIEIQTMHGTPLKTLGLDVTNDFPTAASIEQYIEKNRRWDYLIVQGNFMKEKGYDCFKFEKKVLKTGYPRTDRMYKNDAAKIEEIKNKLGLPLDKKIIFYAPTWRVKNRFDMMMDLELMKEKLKDDYIIMIRMHHFAAKGYSVPEDGEFIFDLGNYQYVEDLYSISDILITDYSSVMFDYALLNKPMIFFVYDMEEYCEALRGLYVDFSQEAPGPLVRNTQEIINAIVNSDEEQKKCSDRIKKFREKFLTYENESSSKLVVKKVMKPSKLLTMLSRK